MGDLQLAILVDGSTIVRVSEISYKSCRGCDFKVPSCKLPKKELGLSEFVCEGYIWRKSTENGSTNGN